MFFKCLRGILATSKALFQNVKFVKAAASSQNAKMTISNKSLFQNRIPSQLDSRNTHINNTTVAHLLGMLPLTFTNQRVIHF